MKVNITDFPKSINYNGKVYFLMLYVTAWDKLCFAYRDALDKDTILSVVVEHENSVPNLTENVEDIVDVPNLGTAMFVAHYRLKDAVLNGIVSINKVK